MDTSDDSIQMICVSNGDTPQSPSEKNEDCNQEESDDVQPILMGPRPLVDHLFPPKTTRQCQEDLYESLPEQLATQIIMAWHESRQIEQQPNQRFSKRACSDTIEEEDSEKKIRQDITEKRPRE